MSFIERCPLFGMSFIGGSTVLDKHLELIIIIFRSASEVGLDIVFLQVQGLEECHAVVLFLSEVCQELLPSQLLGVVALSIISWFLNPYIAWLYVILLRVCVCVCLFG